MRACTLIALVILVAGATANAQVPRVQVWFSEEPPLFIPSSECLGVGTIQTLYVVAIDFGAYFNAVEFAVEFPTTLNWISDVASAPIVIGSAPDGVALSWAMPQNGFQPIVVHQMVALWNCDSCPAQTQTTFVRVQPHPISGFVRAVRWPDFAVIDVEGGIALICGGVPVEETSWGKVKSLYN